MARAVSGISSGSPRNDELEQESEWALLLTRAARSASPDDAQKLGEIAARIFHRVAARHRKPILPPNRLNVK